MNILLLGQSSWVMWAGEFLGILIAGIGFGVFATLKHRFLAVKWNIIKEKTEKQIHTNIHERLSELRVDLNASRVLVFQYHNGGKFYDGTSINRFSVTHESCSSEAKSMILESQDLLVTRYMDMFDLLEKDPNFVQNTSDILESAFRMSLEINGVIHFSISPLKAVNNITPIGFVLCHWCDSYELDKIYKTTTDLEIHKLIKDKTKLINSQLVTKGIRR